MANNNNDQGRGWFGDSERHAQVGSEGGKSQGQDTNSGNFARDRKKAQRVGRKGGSK